MWQAVEVSVPHYKTEELLAALKQTSGLFSLQVQRGASITPPGDVIQARVRNSELRALLRVLDERGVAGNACARISTSEDASASRVPRELTWEEIELTICEEANTTPNSLLLMAVAGGLAAVGLATNALHYVIAAMIIGPGYAPLARIALAASGSAAWRRGIRDVAAAYLALIAAAAVTAAAFVLCGHAQIGGLPSYIGPYQLIAYWRGTSAAGLTMDLIGGIAAAVFVSTGRSILTAGVMIGLALIPSAASIGVGIANLDLGLVEAGALNWVLRAGLILLGSVLVFEWKRRSLRSR